ncbi:MAG: starch-binding protein [Ruminococcus sp.]|nr:starch-binding protein [Ruminococcus sp.]MBQ6153553.1 starch-binding protein [Ruminococcus sp.]
MRTSKMSMKIVVAVTLTLSILMSFCLCAFAANAQEKEEIAPVGADSFYLYGLNTNDPDFGSMSGPTGAFTYDSGKGYYYIDITSFGAGDYCFFVSSVSSQGGSAYKSIAISSVANSGSYYLSAGNYRGYSCMHLWNPNKDSVRIYFTSQSSGLNAVKAGSDAPVNPTNPPVNPTDPPVSQGTVYFQNDPGWTTPHVYMWNGESKNAEWPGQAMTKVSGNIWKYEVTGSWSNIIFNMGSEAAQTTDLTYPGAGYLYTYSTGQWSVYGDTPVTPTDPPVNPTNPPVNPTNPPSGKNMVYCKNEAGWGSVYAYMWTGSSSSNAQWPGIQMTKVSGDIWSYEVTGSWQNIIFNIGSAQTQTGDMTYPGAGYIYNNATNEWSIYDTSPLQVTSFKTDVESPQYNGVAITLSAEATGQGTVYYKFSVKNNTTGAVTTLSNFSTKNYALWTPTVTGTYTLTYDFKDAKGNTNTRSAQYSITDGASSIAPYIKSLTPSSGQIKKGDACNLQAAAGGGFTGTKLLFYKYTITDPSGNTINTPYYTRNTSYSFTPSALGNYTVVLTVQGSDNQDVSRAFVLSSVTNPSDPQDQTLPPETPTSSSGFTMKGDADKDGVLSVIDATTIQKFLASIYGEDKINKANADVDGDNVVSVIDATIIQKKLANVPVNW